MADDNNKNDPTLLDEAGRQVTQVGTGIYDAGAGYIQENVDLVVNPGKHIDEAIEGVEGVGNLVTGFVSAEDKEAYFNDAIENSKQIYEEMKQQVLQASEEAVATGTETQLGTEVGVGFVLGIISPAKYLKRFKIVCKVLNKVGKIKKFKRRGNAVIGKMPDLKARGALKDGEHTLLDKLPNQGSPKANWKQNSSVLREEMRNGVPIRDASAHKPDGFPDPTPDNPSRTVGQSFLGAERNELRNKGWTFDGEYWNPPKGWSPKPLKDK